MQITLSWTRVVDTAADEGERVTREALWEAMLHKAENPVGYVPAITECRVVERYPDGGYLREAHRGKRILRQRVKPDKAAWRITFRSSDTTDFAEIANQVGETGDGRLTLTLLLTLTEDASAAAAGVSRGYLGS
ncbi:DUF1857 family protein [Streptacidiphilus sp. 4-A2]|nr:DUF1857 family protein [Streptacidiphilus sp. 4-A2]